MADDEDDEREFKDACDRCGGEGFIEYLEAGPDVWGEDCPSEVNHLVMCPDCDGTGLYRPYVPPATEDEEEAPPAPVSDGRKD